MIELQRESDSFLISALATGSDFIGFLVLGPKDGGEVFVLEEKRLVATVSPILAIAIDKSQLSEDLRDLNQRLIHAEESERGRVAGDVHDGPLQRALLIIRENEGASGAIDELARQIVFDLREISSRLRPSILDDLGIVSSLDWLLNDVSKRSSLQTNLLLEGLEVDERLTPDVELVLFRVAQEASNNALKHSGGTSLEVTLNRYDHDLILRVADNGKGFARGLNKKGGSGLPGMRERVVQLGGCLEVTSVPDMGTTVVARIPYG